MLLYFSALDPLASGYTSTKAHLNLWCQHFDSRVIVTLNPPFLRLFANNYKADTIVTIRPLSVKDC